MKRKIELIIIVFVIFCILILMSNQSYGICNTIRFSKEVSAVQLILADGRMLYDIKVDKNVNDQQNLRETSYKNLNLVFVVETENGVAENKASVAQFINQIYALYGDNDSKIKMGIVPFKDLSEEQIAARTVLPASMGNILKNSKTDILNDVNNLQADNTRTLQEALMAVQESLSDNPYGGSNGELLQYMVLITDGIQNENMCVSSNVILKDLSENMVSMYGMMIGTNANTNPNMQKLFNRIYEMQVANNVLLANVAYQLKNGAYEYISQFIIKESTLMPSGGDANTVLTPDRVILTADEEILHGATLKIEYIMSCSRYAAYGSGQIYSGKILDLKDEKLLFARDEKLITDPSKTNADYGWEMTSEGLVTTQVTDETKLMLSVLITPESLGDATYRNSAKCATSFDVGFGSTANYTLSDKALDVQILPPFGLEENNSNNGAAINTKLLYGGIAAGVVIVAGMIAFIKKRKKKSK